MFDLQPVNDFFSAIDTDARISPTHISLYMTLLMLWNENGGQSPIRIFSKSVMQISKISGVATYHKGMRELHEYGYIQYSPSYYRFVGSMVTIKPLNSLHLEERIQPRRNERANKR